MRAAAWWSLVAFALLVSCADPHRLRDAGDGSVIKSSGDLKVMLLLTDDLNEIQQRWAQPNSPTLDPINAARVGEPVYAVLIFTGCAADPSGNCRLVADITFTDPEGLAFKSAHDRPVCLGAPPPYGQLQLAQEATSATVTHGPRGTYTVSVSVHDRVLSTGLDLETSFLLH